MTVRYRAGQATTARRQIQGAPLTPWTLPGRGYGAAAGSSQISAAADPHTAPLFINTEEVTTKRAAFSSE